ncbi:MAG TPA: metalloregulator ArsR/SmtB family transcription factor [Ktedonosporobacter sp.]|nr:metalloregulator ArsR/SmtB family transcription factor [Ktedonosporobacter sp.]
MQQPSSPTSGSLHRSVDLSECYQALGDPLRLKIVEILCEQPMDVQTLNERLDRHYQKPVAQPTVSAALQKLRDHGLVTYRPAWRNHEYSANKLILEQMTSITRIVFRLESGVQTNG